MLAWRPPRWDPVNLADYHLDKLSGKICEPCVARMVKVELVAVAERSADTILGGLKGNASMYRKGEGWWIFIKEDTHDNTNMAHTQYD